MKVETQEIIMNPVSLKFSGNFEKIFLKDFYKNSKNNLRLNFGLGIIIYALYIFFDILMLTPYETLNCIIIKLFITVFTIIIWLLSANDNVFKYWKYVMSFSIFIVGLSIIKLATIFGETRIIYFVGLILLLTYSNTFIQIAYLWILLPGIFLSIIFNITVLTGSQLLSSHLILINLFLITANIIICLIGYNIEKGIRKEYLSRYLLKIEKEKEKNAKINLEKKGKERIEELIKAKIKVEESDNLKSAFLANMSHEIRTPMNGIIGFSRLLTKENLTKEKIINYTDVIIEKGNHLSKLINDIMDISKIESKQLEIFYSGFSLNTLLDDINSSICIELMEKQKTKINFSLAKGFSDKNSYIVSDRTRIRQVLINLINNAIKFTESGTIECGYLSTDNKTLKFYIIDTGIGISKENQEVIFERFRKTDNTISQKYSGSGLGLSISKSIIEIMNGKIWVQSEEGQGSSFFFTIPYMKADILIEKTNDELNSNDDILQNLNILIVEDDKQTVNFLEVAFEPLGISVLHAQNGEEGIAMVRKNDNIDLVLMDIRLPKLNGYEATKQIKQIRPDLPVIAQTAFAMTEDRRKALDAGCDEYIPKPTDFDVLIGIIKKFVRK